MIIQLVRFRRTEKSKDEYGIRIEAANDIIIDDYGKQVKIVYDYTIYDTRFSLDLTPTFTELKNNQKKKK